LEGVFKCVSNVPMKEELLQSQFEELKDRLLSLSLKYQRSWAEAEDAVSETFVQVLEKMEYFENRSKFTTWVYSICINKNLEILRRKKTLVKHMNLYFRNMATAFGPDSKEPSMLRHDFREALDKLDERERSVFLLTVYEEMSQKEIAEILELSISNVKVILHRGRKKLMGLLKEYVKGGSGEL